MSSENYFILKFAIAIGLCVLVSNCAQPTARTLTADEINAQISQSEQRYVEELSRDLSIFNNVAFGLGLPLRKFLSEKNNVEGKSLLDLGSGSGVLSLIALTNGANKAVATDINPYAVANADYNAKLLGFTDKMDVRLVSMDNMGAYSVINKNEKFDLIVSNPPQGGRKPKSIYDYSQDDPELAFFRSIVEGLNEHLTTNGKGVFALYYRPLTIAQIMAKQLNLEIHILLKTSNKNGDYYLVELQRAKP